MKTKASVHAVPLRTSSKEDRQARALSGMDKQISYPQVSASRVGCFHHQLSDMPPRRHDAEQHSTTTTAVPNECYVALDVFRVVVHAK